ncbi:MAG: NUDIX domain-containing protein [bacterium]
MRLLLPSVSAHVFDQERRLLLVCQRDSSEWSTPGGMIEPDEMPADAAVRETWEETGLVVSPERILGVFGGPAFVVNYPGGDQVQYVITAFACVVMSGELRVASDETSNARFYTEREASALPLAPWLRSVLSDAFTDHAHPRFHRGSAAAVS